MTDEIKRRGRPRRVEGEASPVTVDIVAAPPRKHNDLGDIVAEFKAKHPVDWEALRLCPLQHGLEEMIERIARG